MSKPMIDNRFMEFRLGNQLYALPLLIVKEVIQRPEITPVPNMPAFFEGMMNLRGQILGVFEIRKKLAVAKDPQNKTPEVVIVIESSGVSVGMIVDEVTRVLHPEPNTMGPAPLKEDDPARKYVVSVIQTKEDLVLTLDVSHLLDLKKYAKTEVAA